MFSGKHAIKLSLVALFMMLLAMPAFAGGDSDSDSDSDSDGASIVGSWEAVSTLNTGQEAPGLFTFTADRTWISSGDNAFLGNGHGAWKRTGHRDFDTLNKAFIFAPDGSLSLVLTNRTEIEVSTDGDSFTAAFASETALPDGTVIGSVAGTAVGTRITVD